jgi:Rod binding domain-containing protein
MQPINPNTFHKVPAAGWAPMTPEQQEAKLKGQVDEFASLLYAQMFQQMREASKSDDEEGGGLFGGDSEMFAHFFDQQVGKAFAAGDGNGLKQALWQQMSKTLEAQQVKAGGDKQ